MASKERYRWAGGIYFEPGGYPDDGLTVNSRTAAYSTFQACNTAIGRTSIELGTKQGPAKTLIGNFEEIARAHLADNVIAPKARRAFPPQPA